MHVHALQFQLADRYKLVLKESMTGVYDLNFRHLRLLVIAGRNARFTDAAFEANISQSALSQAVAKLEVAFAVQIFSRTSHGVAPTAAGRQLLNRTERAIAHFVEGLPRTARADQYSAMGQHFSGVHVRGLLALAEVESFTHAAQRAGVSVPALHRAVRDLEKICGISLVESRGRGVGLTKAARKLVGGFTLGVSELQAALDDSRRGNVKLAIGAMALSRSVLLPATLAQLLETMPNAQIDIVEGSYLELVDLLRSGRIDVMVGALRENPPRDLKQEALFSDKLTIVGRASHPLANKKASFEDLASFPWIVARRASGLLERWRSLFDEADKPRPNAPVQCGSSALIRGMLVRSNFLTLLSIDQVATEMSAGTIVRINSTLPDTERLIGLITRKDWYPTQLHKSFIEFLRINIP